MAKKTLAFFVILVLAASLLPLKTDAAISGWQQGASIAPCSRPKCDPKTDFSSGTFQQSLRDLKATGANYVTLIIPYYQSNIWSTDLNPGWNTPTDQSLIDGINFAHSLGLAVNLKPHAESYDGQWRANINPSDRNGWFTAYGNILNHLADIAAQRGVEEITIGSELIKMAAATENSTNTQHWLDLIAAVRSRYGGQLTYSANWGGSGWTDEKNHIQFWNALDYIGIAAYFNLPSGDNSVGSLSAQWSNWQNNDIGPLQARWGKPVIFTEVGYRSLSGTRYEPWNSWNGGAYDGTEQANLYTALFSFWQNQSYFKGIQLWDWSSDPNAGWPGNIDYTPQHKPAQDVMTQWFSNSAPTPLPPANISFNTTGSLSQSTASVSVKNNGSAISGVITDIEIYNSSGQKILQKVYQNQNFAVGETKSYSEAWSAQGNGVYTLKVGIFDANWNLYKWNDNVSQFTVNSTTPPPANSQVEIWWPTNGVTVSGTQPFKAMLSNRDISQYKMFWQVDGDLLNEMANSSQDYPHKESIVDLSGWTWKNTGPYGLNFLAKDLSGNTIAQKLINIYVAH